LLPYATGCSLLLLCGPNYIFWKLVSPYCTFMELVLY
jgi:hypothetical protein